ncbi:MAG: 50S ribosomal protein L18 [Pseudomonadota bacterium]
MNKRNARQRRATKTRAKIRTLGKPRLSIHRTPRHIYAQVLSADGGQVVASASTVAKSLREGIDKSGNVDAARAVGKAVAEASVAAGVTSVAFDRSGFRYHGRVKALADAAREGGLQF